MKCSALLPAIALLVPTLAAAQGVDLNTITKVEVKGATIEITGTKKPNFTTFTMTDPARLVIDISEAVFQGVPDELQVGNGTVTAIKTASYGSDASAIARVLIGFEKEYETDIQSSGSKLVVKVLGAGGTAVAQADTTPPPQDDSAAKAAQAEADRKRQEQEAAAAQAEADKKAQQQAAAQAEADRKKQEQEAAQAAAQAEADRKKQEQQAAAAAEAERKQQAQAEAEKKRQEEEAARAAAAEEKRQKQLEAMSEAERKKQEAADAKAAAAAEKQKQQEEARAEAERKKQEAAEAKAAAAEERKAQQEEARAEAERKKQEAAEAKAAAIEEKKRQQEEARAEAERKRQEAAEAKRQKLAMNEAGSDSRAQTDTATRGGADASDTGGQISVSNRRKVMELVGFKLQNNSSRVFVRTNEPVRYTVSKGEKNTVVVELENTRIDLDNNERPLDASFFEPNAVAMIAPKPGPTKTVRIQIQLKESVPYQTSQQGNEVYIDFERPMRK